MQEIDKLVNVEKLLEIFEKQSQVLAKTVNDSRISDIC